jgi:hypothetical protein
MIMSVGNVKTIVKVALGIIVVLLIVLPISYAVQQSVLGMNLELQAKVAKFQGQVISLNDQLADLRSHVIYLYGANASMPSSIEDFQSLQTQISTLKSGATELQNQLSDLRNRLNALKTPKILTSLGTTDVRSNVVDTRFYIKGTVWNVGVETAFNSSLHVTLYRGAFIVNETYLMLGDLPGGSWKEVETNIHYSGAALTNWTIIPIVYP